MASKIVPGNVDGTYPKAGQDNSSQGFRDNFSAIKNNFTEAKSEIDSLQLNKASLNSSSDFNDNEVLKANFITKQLQPMHLLHSHSQIFQHQDHLAGSY